MSDAEDDITAAAFEALSLNLATTPPNPAHKAPYPTGLALDLALQTHPLKVVLEEYGIPPAKAREIFANPAFRQEYDAHKEAMKQDGWTFRQKAKAQSEAYLDLLWNMAHSESVPAPVRADIVKNTVKWAALDNAAAQNAQPANAITPELVKSLAEMPDNELEVRVLSIISRKAPRSEPAAAEKPGRLIENGS